MHYRLLEAFRGAFEGQKYKHRDQTIGNSIAMFVYDDLLAVARSPKYVNRATSREVVVNTANQVRGRKGRRGDGTLGSLIPGETSISVPPYDVGRGPIADLQIGAEMKILAKSMIKQIDRVMNDLDKQAKIFSVQTASSIRVAFVGVNCSDNYVGYEGDREYPSEIPPSREAPEAIRRIDSEIRSKYDELIFLRFKATNVAPNPFVWVNEKEVRQDYSAALLRMSTEYERRF